MSITVLDENDNHPQFSQLLYTWSISEGSLPGQAFIDVEAWDIDLGINADILYSIDRRSIGSKCIVYVVCIVVIFCHFFFMLR